MDLGFEGKGGGCLERQDKVAKEVPGHSPKQALAL